MTLVGRRGFIFLNINLKHCSKFTEFKGFVEKQSGLSIKVLRSDRGGEYMSNEILDYCSHDGIRK